MSFECWIYWARPHDARPWHRELFTEAERGRADAYRREVDRDRFTVGCALSRIGLGQLLGLDPAAVPLLRDCADCGKPHGKPRVPPEGEWPPAALRAVGRPVEPKPTDAIREPAHLSISHSGDHVVVAITRTAPIGIDVEQWDDRSLSVAETVLTPTEQARLSPLTGRDRLAAFFRHWTGKEAALKAIGRGLAIPMATFELTDDVITVVTGDHDLTTTMAPLRLIELPVDDDHSATLALAHPATPRPIHIDGSPLLRRD